MAHEIRNPLGAISHAAELLGEAQSAGTPASRLAEIVVENCRRIDGLITSVMQLGRRNAGATPALELLPVAQRFARDFCQTLDISPQSVAVEGRAPDVLFRADQLMQVLTNLGENALRHTPPDAGAPGVRIVVGVDATSARPFLDVIDRGEGVPAESADRIFEPFFTTRSDGTGLGLYIARELCAANGAALQYRPMPRGSCFRITFSAARLTPREVA